MIKFILLSLLPVLSWASDHQAETLPFFSATYTAKINGITINATREFKPINDQIAELSFHANSLIAKLTEVSRFSWCGQQIKPNDFFYQRTVLGKKKQQQLTFDWPNRKVISIEQDKTTVMDNDELALDRLSFQLQLQYDLLQKRRKLGYRIADKGRIKHYRFEVIEHKPLETSLGILATTKIKVLRENKNRITYLWLASDWHNMLTRLEQYKEGKKEFELQITSAVIDGKAMKGI